MTGGFLVQTHRPRHRRRRPTRRWRPSGAPTAAGAARSRLRLARLQARQVERHRVRRPAGAPLGIGAGQMSRVDSVRIARQQGARRRWPGSVVASDAFFPFRDGVDAAAEAGAAAIIQPGGSVRDAEVDRRRRRARDGDGAHRRAPLPALAMTASSSVGSGGREHALAWKIGAEPAVRAAGRGAGQSRASRRLGAQGRPACRSPPTRSPSWSPPAVARARSTWSSAGPRRRWLAGLGDAVARGAGSAASGRRRRRPRSRARRRSPRADERGRACRPPPSACSRSVAAAEAFIDAQPGERGGQGRRAGGGQGRGGRVVARPRPRRRRATCWPSAQLRRRPARAS